MADHINDKDTEAEREAFETWCIRKGYSTNKWHDGGYVDSNTQNGWEVWRAARRTSPAAAVGAEGLPPLPRYKLVPGDQREWLAPADDGAWCRWDHVQNFIAADRQARAGQEVEQPADRDAVRAQAIEDACHAEIRDLRAQLAQHERVHQIMVDTVGDLGRALYAARDMVGHPDNIAFIDRAIAMAGVKSPSPSSAPQASAAPAEREK